MMIPSPEQLENGKKLSELIAKGIAASYETVVKQARYHGTPIICWDWNEHKIIEVDPFSVKLSQDTP